MAEAKYNPRQLMVYWPGHKEILAQAQEVLGTPSMSATVRRSVELVLEQANKSLDDIPMPALKTPTKRQRHCKSHYTKLPQ